MSFELYGMAWLAARVGGQNDVYTLTSDNGALDEYNYLTGLDDEEYTP